MKRRLKRILTQIRAHGNIRIVSDHGKSRLRAQNRRIQPILTAMRDCWMIAQVLNCPDSLKHCSAFSLGISLSWYGVSLFGDSSSLCRLPGLCLIWLNGHTVAQAAYAKNGTQIKLFMIWKGCFCVWQTMPNCTVLPGKVYRKQSQYTRIMSAYDRAILLSMIA